ncbi:MAG: hypothetical protein AABY88_10650 [Pseudomonadota bacterium]
MRRLWIAIALLVGNTSPAAAQSAPDRADARCILVLALAARNPAQKDAAGRGQFYYYGRVAARGTASKFGPVLASEAKTTTTPQKLQAELARCSAELTVANAALRDSLKEVEAAAQQPPKPGGVPSK